MTNLLGHVIPMWLRIANAVALNDLHIVKLNYGRGLLSIYLLSGLRKPTQASRTC